MPPYNGGRFTREQIGFLRKVEIGARRYQKMQSLGVTAPKLAALQAEANARAAKAAALEAERKANAKSIRKSAAAKKKADAKLKKAAREEKRKATVIRSITRKIATGKQSTRNTEVKRKAKAAKMRASAKRVRNKIRKR